jgi:hypothetical protein
VETVLAKLNAETERSAGVSARLACCRQAEQYFSRRPETADDFLGCPESWTNQRTECAQSEILLLLLNVSTDFGLHRR